MNGALAPDGNIIKCISKLYRRAEVLHGQKVVRRIEHRRDLSEQSVRRLRARRGERRAAGERCFQRLGKRRRIECCRRHFERGEIAALAAEGERADNARRAEQPHAAAGKALR